MADYRTTILRAVAAADRLHREYDTERRMAKGAGRIDVFRMFIDREVPLVFRPLKGLLGAYLDAPASGVLVTTQRPLSVQRFTAAHELGHYILKHTTSLDDDSMLARTPFTRRGTYDEREAAADAFAAELLMPEWLFARHFEQQQWARHDLTEPSTMYQLAIRMGVSYAAACHSAMAKGIITDSVCRRLVQIPPKQLKQELADGVDLKAWYGDVWVVTENDQDLLIEGSRDDLVVLRLREHSGSGFIWRFEDLLSAGMTILDDRRVGSQDDSQVERFGGTMMRCVFAQGIGYARGDVQLQETRPWMGDSAPLSTLSVHVDLYGPAPEGLLTAQKEQELLAGAA